MSSIRNPKILDASKQSLVTIKGKQPGFLSRYLIRYDTWIQHFTPKSRRRKRSEQQQANLDQSVRNHHNKLECSYLSVQNPSLVLCRYMEMQIHQFTPELCRGNFSEKKRQKSQLSTEKVIISTLPLGALQMILSLGLYQ